MLRLFNEDCLDVLTNVLDENSIDTIITDPPYGLEFMGKGWDKGVPAVEFWQAMLVVAKPGAMLLAFGGTRTFHRMAVAIEDAGWEIRDCLVWMYASGFPKSHNFGCKCNEKTEQTTEPHVRPVPNADLPTPVDAPRQRGEILFPVVQEQSAPSDRPAGPESANARGEQSCVEGRGDVLEQTRQLPADQICAMSDGFSANGAEGRLRHGTPSVNGPESGSAAEPNGSSTPSEPQPAGQPTRKSRAASKQRKSQIGRTGTCIACGGLRDWRGYGTALKPAWEPIIVAMKPLDGTFAENAEKWGVAGINVDGGRIGTSKRHPGNYTSNKFGGRTTGAFGESDRSTFNDSQGRWPANLLLDEDAAAMLDEQSGKLKSGTLNGTEYLNGKIQQNAYGSHKGHLSLARKGDSGGASRFFYCAKASKSERNAGCEGLPGVACGAGTMKDDNFKTGSGNPRNTIRKNFHPTVKPLKLMEYLCLLTKTPTGGVVLDPFMGSGTTGIAALKTGRSFIGIEKESQYFAIAAARIEAVDDNHSESIHSAADDGPEQTIHGETGAFPLLPGSPVSPSTDQPCA